MESVDRPCQIIYGIGMKTRVVILAAGRGTRMNLVRNNSDQNRDVVSPLTKGISNGVNTETPKVLIPFRGKPMIGHLLDAVKDSGVVARLENPSVSV